MISGSLDFASWKLRWTPGQPRTCRHCKGASTITAIQRCSCEKHSVSNVILDGEVQLGADGVLQGWCWNPNRPTERLVLEILIDERIVSTFVASRFREDLGGRNIGDGYYGFIATLTRSLLDAGDNFVVSVRERASGCCFWRQVSGESGLPNDFTGRFAQAQRRFSRVAQSSWFRTRSTSSLTSRISTELGALGMHLQAVS